MPEQNLATIRRFWDSINNRDVDGYLSTFAEGGIAHDPVSQPPLRTTDERRAFMEGLLGSFTTLHATLDFVTSCGDSTAAKWTVEATSTTGDPVHLEGIDIYQHAPDGRVKEMWGYFQM